jgi:hypothetical protein
VPSNEFHFVTRWRVEGTPREVFDVLDDPTDLPRWWPSVYLDVRELEPGEDGGAGKVVCLLTWGRLPYKLRWCFRATGKERPSRIALDAWGDLEGHGEWAIAGPGAADRGGLRLAGPGREAAAPLPVVPAQARLLGQPPLGDGTGRGEPEG